MKLDYRKPNAIMLANEGFSHILLDDLGNVFNLKTGKQLTPTIYKNGIAIDLWKNNKPHNINIGILLRKYFTNDLDIIPPDIISLDFLGFKNYSVTSCGKVWSNRLYKFPKQHRTTKGYRGIGLTNSECRRSFKVHRLVAMAFIPNPDDLPEVNHIDGDKTNNHVDNLEWITTADNLKHARDNGFKRNSISDEQIHIACIRLEKGDKIRHIANDLNVNEYAVGNLKRGTHSHIVSQYNIKQNTNSNSY